MTDVGRDGGDLVVGIDSSTQSTKAVAFDAAGRLVAEGRAPIPLSNPRPGWFEQDPEDWWRSLATALRQLTAAVDPARIGGIAISNQRETLSFLDDAGASLRPAMLWLDERSRDSTAGVVEALGADALHRLTGKPCDLTPTIYRIAWMRDREPALYDRVRRFADVHAWLVARLTGEFATSWASADPLGIFDIARREWAPDVLAHLRIDASRLARPVPPAAPLGTVTPAVAAETGLAAGTPVFAGAGDGQCAALGTRCVAPGQGYLNLGTALVAGVWSAEPAVGRHWRTMISATGTGYMLESVQRTGTFLVDWLINRVAGPEGLRDHAGLEAAAAAIPIGSDGVLTLPYWSGCMDPHWDHDASGCVVGLHSAHGIAHLYRSALEGLTLEVARAATAMAGQGVPVEQFVVMGGGANSRLWVQMVADATGRDALICDTVEASALGAAMLAARGAGWFPTVEDAAASMRGALRPVHPIAANVGRYAELLALHGRVYASNRALLHGIAAFRRAAA